jgi:hypothetical protein
MKHLMKFEIWEGAMANQKSIDQFKKVAKGTATSIGAKDMAKNPVQSKEQHDKTAKPPKIKGVSNLKNKTIIK